MPPKKAASGKKATKATKANEKPVQVVAVVTPNGIEGTFTPEPRKPLICHLPFESREVKFTDQPLIYDPTPPIQEPEGYAGDDQYFGVTEKEKEKITKDDAVTYAYSDTWVMAHEQKGGDEKSGVSSAAAVAAPMPETQWKKLGENFERCDLMSCYKKGEEFVIPESTAVHCFWCAHGFEGVPCFLPMREEKGAYHIYGNFCTPQCALAYLLKEGLDPHVRWERMALLHRLYKPKKGGRIFPAPPRESLQWFGGPYSYDEFREIVGENKIRIDIQMPPMVSILGSLDTKPIDFYDSSLQNTFTQGLLGVAERFSKPATDGQLRLKRSKPLKDHESTLDACIQIQVKQVKATG